LTTRKDNGTRLTVSPSGNRTRKRGKFSVSLDDLILDQGQIAIQIEIDNNGSLRITSYQLPSNNSGAFARSEIQAAYIKASTKIKMEKADKHLLEQYLGGVDNRVPAMNRGKTYQQFMETHEIFAKKYKPVAVKVRPVLTDLPPEYHIIREIQGDPLKDLSELPLDSPEFEPGEQYRLEQWEIVEKQHNTGFLTEREVKIVHWMFKVHEMAFAWNEEQKNRKDHLEMTSSRR
jgi:hypothetical protein